MRSKGLSSSGLCDVERRCQSHTALSTIRCTTAFDRPCRHAACPMANQSEGIIWRALLQSTPLILGVVAFVVCVIVAPHRLDNDLLNASVQIIPFLLLALALETRLL